MPFKSLNTKTLPGAGEHSLPSQHLAGSSGSLCARGISEAVGRAGQWTACSPGAGLHSSHSTQCGRRGRRWSWSPPHSTACTAWPPSACAVSPAAPVSAGSWGPRSCCSSCCSPRPSGASWEGCARFWRPGPPRRHCTEPSWHGHTPPLMFF